MQMRFFLNLIRLNTLGKNRMLFLLLFAIVAGGFAACSHPDSAERHKEYVENEIVRTRDTTFSVTYQTLLKLLKESERVKDTGSQKKILSIIIARLHTVENFDLARRYGQTFYKLSEKTGDTAGMFLALRQLCQTGKGANNMEDALLYARKSLNLLRTSGYFKLVDTSGQWNANNEAYRRLAALFIADIYRTKGNFDSSMFYIALAREYTGRNTPPVSHYKALSYLYESMGENEKELSVLDSLVTYIDSIFSVAKRPVRSFSSVEFYVRIAKLYFEKGDLRKALEYLNRVDEVKVPPMLLNSPSLGIYQNVFRYFTEAYSLKDSIYRLQGNTKAGEDNYKKITEVDDLMNRVYKQKEVMDARILVNTLEFRDFMEQEKTRRERVIFTGVSVLVLFFLLVAGGCFYIFHKKKLRKKNRAIATLSRIYNASGGDPVVPDPAMPRQESGFGELFLKMEAIMAEKRPYLRASFGRKDLAALATTDAAYIHLAIKENTQFNNFEEYVNAYRVAYACSLMKNGGACSMDGIAAASGFVSQKALSRAFLEQISITPGEFAETLKEIR